MQFTCTTRKIMNPCKSFSASFFMQKERLINSECACKNLLPFLRSLELSPAWLYCQRKKKSCCNSSRGNSCTPRPFFNPTVSICILLVSVHFSVNSHCNFVHFFCPVFLPVQSWFLQRSKKKS